MPIEKSFANNIIMYRSESRCVDDQLLNKLGSKAVEKCLCAPR